MEGGQGVAMPRIRLFDVCAGIGGNSYAFHSFAQTKLYSEINRGVVPILKSAMKKGHIDEAPVVGDILSVSEENIKYHFANGIDMLTAGYPCQGNSKMGLRLGLDDSRSGLIKGIFDKIKLWKPKFVFLENVVDVLVNGSAKFVIDSFIESGYNVAWGIVGADDVGFRHQRERWFCLASLPTCLELLEQCVGMSEQYVLLRQLIEPARMVPEREGERLAALGNGVVPQAVKKAFEILARVILKPPVGLVQENSTLPKWAYFSGDKKVALQPPSFEETRFRHEDFDPLTFIPDAYVSTTPASSMATSGFLTHQTKRRAWSTPRHGQLWACNFLTNRAERDLSTQMRFEKDTPDEIRKFNPSPQFLEFLMGYPASYTEILTDDPDEVQTNAKRMKTG